MYVRPELVVEIAFSDLQESSRYPGGLALRLARVKRYRGDKQRASEADTMEGCAAYVRHRAVPAKLMTLYRANRDIDRHARCSLSQGRIACGPCGICQCSGLKRPVLLFIKAAFSAIAIGGWWPVSTHELPS